MFWRPDAHVFLFVLWWRDSSFLCVTEIFMCRNLEYCQYFWGIKWWCYELYGCCWINWTIEMCVWARSYDESFVTCIGGQEDFPGKFRPSKKNEFSAFPSVSMSFARLSVFRFQFFRCHPLACLALYATSVWNQACTVDISVLSDTTKVWLSCIYFHVLWLIDPAVERCTFVWVRSAKRLQHRASIGLLLLLS